MSEWPVLELGSFAHKVRQLEEHVALMTGGKIKKAYKFSLKT
jgi:hypothetical protein